MSRLISVSFRDENLGTGQKTSRWLGSLTCIYNVQYLLSGEKWVVRMLQQRWKLLEAAWALESVARTITHIVTEGFTAYFIHLLSSKTFCLLLHDW